MKAPKERNAVVLGMILTGKGRHSRNQERLNDKSRNGSRKQERRKGFED